VYLYHALNCVVNVAIRDVGIIQQINCLNFCLQLYFLILFSLLPLVGLVYLLFGEFLASLMCFELLSVSHFLLEPCLVLFYYLSHAIWYIICKHPCLFLFDLA